MPDESVTTAPPSPAVETPAPASPLAEAQVTPAPTVNEGPVLGSEVANSATLVSAPPAEAPTPTLSVPSGAETSTGDLGNLNASISAMDQQAPKGDVANSGMPASTLDTPVGGPLPPTLGGGTQGGNEASTVGAPVAEKVKSWKNLWGMI